MSSCVEVAEARREALKRADPALPAGKKPGDLRMTRMQDRGRGIKTARGGIRYARQYLYFPDLKVGVSPPDRRLGMPEGKLTPRLERDLLEHLANDDYRDSAKGLEVFGCTISHVHQSH